MRPAAKLAGPGLRCCLHRECLPQAVTSVECHQLWLSSRGLQWQGIGWLLAQRQDWMQQHILHSRPGGPATLSLCRAGSRLLWQYSYDVCHVPVPVFPGRQMFTTTKSAGHWFWKQGARWPSPGLMRRCCCSVALGAERSYSTCSHHTMSATLCISSFIVFGIGACKGRPFAPSLNRQMHGGPRQATR